jgi:hypothetical protein
MSKYVKLLIVAFLVALLLGAVLTSVASAWGPYPYNPGWGGYYPHYGGYYPYWGGGYPYWNYGYYSSCYTYCYSYPSWGPYWGGGWWY